MFFSVFLETEGNLEHYLMKLSHCATLWQLKPADIVPAANKEEVWGRAAPKTDTSDQFISTSASARLHHGRLPHNNPQTRRTC